MKKEIDHAVTIDGQNYKYDDMFKMTDSDRKILRKSKHSAQISTHSVLANAAKVRFSSSQSLAEQSKSIREHHLGLSASLTGIATGNKNAAMAKEVQAFLPPSFCTLGDQI